VRNPRPFRSPRSADSEADHASNGVWPLHRHSVVDGGDIVGIMQGIDPAIRYRKAHRLLRLGGHLAFWSARHAFPAGFDPFFAEIQEVYDAIGESRPGEWPPPSPEQIPDEAAEIEASTLFEEIQVRRYVWEKRYTAEEYIALLNTFSGHIAMDAAKREQLYREIRHRISRRPDASVRRHWSAILHVARRALEAPAA